MLIDITIEAIDSGSDLLETLADEARAQGYYFMDKSLYEVRSGANAFQKPGECFCGVFVNRVLLGCGGINQDPYVDQPVGRLRHIYVRQAYRRKGIAAAIVRDLLRRCKPVFETVRLRTPDESANRFYDDLGFKRVDDETATHIIEI